MPSASPILPGPLAADADAPHVATVACGVCGESLEGRYCHACGEPRPEQREESIAQVLLEGFQEVTSADGKLWQSVRVLFLPGHLTAAYFEGRAGRYLRPFRLFLIANVVLFFLLGFLQQNPLVGELNMQRQSLGLAVAAAADARLAAWGGSPELFEYAFNTRSRTLASTLIVLFIPMFAGMFALAFGWGRGARHLVFATHMLTALIAFYISITAVMFALFVGIGERNIGGEIVNWSLVLVVWSLMAAFIAVGAQRVYGVPRWRAWLGGTVVSVVGLAASVMVYRIVLFWLTLWTLRLPPA